MITSENTFLPVGQPPSYDAAVGQSTGSAAGPSASVAPVSASPDLKYPTPNTPPPAGDSSSKKLSAPYHNYETSYRNTEPSGPATYRYQNFYTGEVVTTLLPPDHPKMICLQQGHQKETKYGLLGILAAIIWFPLGIGCCLLDRRVVCSRCGELIEDSFSC